MEYLLTRPRLSHLYAKEQLNHQHQEMPPTSETLTFFLLVFFLLLYAATRSHTLLVAQDELE